MRPYFQPSPYFIPRPFNPYPTSLFWQGARNFVPPVPTAPPLGPGALGSAALGTAPLGIDKWLTQANQLMTSAQKYAPIIQQARPMFKNLPALWKLYKGFQSIPSEDNANENEPIESRRLAERRRKTSQQELPKKIETKPSLPKIYQPQL